MLKLLLKSNSKQVVIW